MSLLSNLARPEILALEPYARGLGDPARGRLHANENPWRFQGDITADGLNRYPAPQPLILEERLAALYGVPRDTVLAGRGSDEGIDLLVRAFCRPGVDAVLNCPPTFSMYSTAARIQGARIIDVPLQPANDYALDERRVLSAASADVRLVFLCSPNNPTGTAYDGQVIRSIALALTGRALVVVDEAYAEFHAGPSMIADLATVPNLVVLRTLSKAWALAGARCGAVVAAPEVIELLARIRPPYAVPTPSIEAALAALAPTNRAEAMRRVEVIRAERDLLIRSLASIPGVTRVWNSSANFVLAKFHDAHAALGTAQTTGFALRDLSANPYTQGCLRVSVGTPAQNVALLSALARLRA